MSFREPNGAVMTNMKAKGGASIEVPSLHGLQGRSATGLNGQAAKDEVSAVRRGLDAGKYFWRSGREKCFSLYIPFNRTSGPCRLTVWGLTNVPTLEVRQLHAVIVFAEERNFTPAADKLHIAQPALTKQIADRRTRAM